MTKSSYQKALEIGRPPNILRKFPGSNALIVSGEVIRQAMAGKLIYNFGNAVALAVNGRNFFIIAAVLLAAQRANAAVIIEIASSEGGKNSYCAVDFWNIASIVDGLCNKLKITIPVAIHIDHYTIKSNNDVIWAKKEIPDLFENYGATSIAIDASHLSNAENLLANIELARLIPKGMGYETETGEIKGKEDKSTVEEALFLIQGLNARGIYPGWLAINNGSSHGLEITGRDIDIDLTKAVHYAIMAYSIDGAQHALSGNSHDFVREIVKATRMTKGNIATALQFLSWGCKVNEFGNAELDSSGHFIKLSDEGVTDELWEKMVLFAETNGWKGAEYKYLNKAFDDQLFALPEKIQERMIYRVEEYAYKMITKVLNSNGTAPYVIEGLIENGSWNVGPYGIQIENPKNWTDDLIIERGKALDKAGVKKGNFDD